MIVRAFADTNVSVYAQSDDGTKSATAIKLLIVKNGLIPYLEGLRRTSKNSNTQ